jgi:hypothetical protein
VIAAPERTNLARANPDARIAPEQHPEELPHLVDVVARLPLGHGAGEDVTRRAQRVQGLGARATRIALLSCEAEIAELQPPSLAHEHVQRREVAVERLAAVQLPEHFEYAGNLAARDALRPPRGVAL